MKTMKIEKKLLFDDKILEVKHIEADEQLHYEREHDGSMRALGPLFIKGEVVNDQNTVVPFQEVLDMDVLAPAYKLGDNDFVLRVADVHHELQMDGVNLYILLNIEGLKEDDDVQETKALKEEKRMEMPIVQPEEIETNTVQKEPLETHDDAIEEAGDDEQFEDLFEDADTTYTSYRMVVAMPNDTYATIARRYDIVEEDLRTVNRNKDVIPKSLIVLPF